VFGAFLYIEGAFDSNTHIIIEAARWHGFKTQAVRRAFLKKTLYDKKLGNRSV
jgi:hypothetical protein